MDLVQSQQADAPLQETVLVDLSHAQTETPISAESRADTIAANQDQADPAADQVFTRLVVATADLVQPAKATLEAVGSHVVQADQAAQPQVASIVDLVLHMVLPVEHPVDSAAHVQQALEVASVDQELRLLHQQPTQLPARKSAHAVAKKKKNMNCVVVAFKTKKKTAKRARKRHAAAVLAMSFLMKNYTSAKKAASLPKRALLRFAQSFCQTADAALSHHANVKISELKQQTP
jgi:hypothetical protein